MPGGKDQTLEPLGYQQITSLAAAVGLTIPARANVALIQAETQDVRFRDDGTNPTASVGALIKAGQMPFLYTGKLGKLKLIEVAASAKLNIAYYA